jgi:hypothetical protein
MIRIPISRTVFHAVEYALVECAVQGRIKPWPRWSEPVISTRSFLLAYLWATKNQYLNVKSQSSGFKVPDPVAQWLIFSTACLEFSTW